MELPRVGSRPEWRAARQELLVREKAWTRARDALNAERRALPMVEIEKGYSFEGATGTVGLAALFAGRRQLIVHHLMWQFDHDQGCPTCSMLIDSMGHPAHLHACDTTLVCVSRAPADSIARFWRRMGWTVPWFSSHGGDFNHDFEVTTADGQDLPGVSAFLRDGDRVFHTYSTYARGAELMLGPYNYLDLTALGRQRYVNEFAYHDRYPAADGSEGGAGAGGVCCSH